MITVGYTVFDSKNTCRCEMRQFNSIRGACETARKNSTMDGVHKIQIHHFGLWEEYENGTVSSWSYPHGLYFYKH